MSDPLCEPAVPLPARRALFVNDGPGDVVDDALGGAPWGALSLAVRFGTAAVRIEGLSSSQLREAVARYGALAVPAASSGSATSATSATLRMVRAPRSAFREIDTRGWVNTMALEHHQDHVVVVGRDFVARVPVVSEAGSDDGACALVATWHEGDGVIAPLENTLRILAAYRALHRGGALLHCAGLVDGGARVCFGPSGIGKSTLAQNWIERGRAILSDELCAVERGEPEDGAYVVEQLPFAGDVAAKALTDARLPLVSMHRLAQGPACDVEAMTTRDAVRALLGCAPFVNIDRYRLGQLMANLEALVVATPVTRLTLTLGADARDVLAIRKTARFALRSDVRYRVIDEEAVVVIQGKSEVMGLNGTGSRALDLAARGNSFAAIGDAIHGDVDVERAVLDADLRAFFVGLVRDGLLGLLHVDASAA